MNCQEFNTIIDSYLSDELLVETNHDVLRHLENCRDCREQTSAHRELRSRLREVVRNEPGMMIDNAFAAWLRADLQKTALRPGFLERLTTRSGFAGLRVAVVGFACLLIVVIGGFFVLRSPNDSAAANTNSQIGQRDTLSKQTKPGWQRPSRSRGKTSRHRPSAIIKTAPLNLTLRNIRYRSTMPQKNSARSIRTSTKPCSKR